jgi:ferredoxin-NADP reductase
LNPFTFTQYELVSKTPVSSTSSIFCLQPVADPNHKVYLAAWRKGIWSVQFKQPQLQIGRDYTPLPPISRQWNRGEEEPGADNEETLRFLIRRDPYGEVSGYLHCLEPGATVDMRGPLLEYELPSDVQEVLFIAGGTGIAPALQAAHSLFRSKKADGTVRMHILWANRRREDCQGGLSDYVARPKPRSTLSWWAKILGMQGLRGRGVSVPADMRQGLIVRQLEDFKSQFPGRFTVDYFVDEEDTLIRKDSILGFLNSGHKSTSQQSPPVKKVILICGPDGFISYLAGPKMWKDGLEVQGPLQGLLGQLDLKGWTVWKL